MTSALDLVTLGGIAWDVIGHPESARVLSLDDGPVLAVPHGGKIHLDEASFAYGGGAMNVAVVGARLGLRTALIARTGDDALGTGAVELLAHEGVEACVHRDPTARSGTSLVLVAPDGDRTILIHAGANAKLVPADVDRGLLARSRWVHVSSLRGEADRLFDELTGWCDAAGVALSLNPGATQVSRDTDGLRTALAACALLTVNAEEARELLDVPHATPPDALARRLRERTHGVVVVTCGAAGSVACDVDGAVLHQAPVPGPIACTLGAGDAFAGTLVAALSVGTSLDEALARAAHNATAVMALPGAHAGALTRDALDARVGLAGATAA
jgi:ribokinase